MPRQLEFNHQLGFLNVREIEFLQATFTQVQSNPAVFKTRQAPLKNLLILDCFPSPPSGPAARQNE